MLSLIFQMLFFYFTFFLFVFIARTKSSYFWGCGYFWLYDEERDLSSRPQMYVLPFTDAHPYVYRCRAVKLPQACGKAAARQR